MWKFAHEFSIIRFIDFSASGVEANSAARGSKRCFHERFVTSNVDNKGEGGESIQLSPIELFISVNYAVNSA
jgi:hypothetical protein